MPLLTGMPDTKGLCKSFEIFFFFSLIAIFGRHLTLSSKLIFSGHEMLHDSVTRFTFIFFFFLSEFYLCHFYSIFFGNSKLKTSRYWLKNNKASQGFSQLSCQIYGRFVWSLFALYRLWAWNSVSLLDNCCICFIAFAFDYISFIRSF